MHDLQSPPANQIRRAELANCGFVRTVLMLAVVVYHCAVFWTGNWISEAPVFPSEVLSVFAKWLNSFHIYGFALVSGYLFFYLKHEAGKYDRFLPFLGNKAKRLLMPYAFASAVWVIPSGAIFLNYSFPEVLQSFLLGCAPQQLWFLLMLFFVFVIVYPLSSFFKEHLILGAAVSLFCYGVGFVASLYLPNVFQIFTAFRYVPFFWLGFVIRRSGSDWLRRIPAPVWLVAHGLLFAGVWLLGKQGGTLFKLLTLAGEFALRAVGALMAFFLLQKIASRAKWRANRAFCFLEKRSMPIYLFHQQIIIAVTLLLNGVWNPYLHAGMNLIAAFGGSILLSSLLLLSKWTRVLIGEK